MPQCTARAAALGGFLVLPNAEPTGTAAAPARATATAARAKRFFMGLPSSRGERSILRDKPLSGHQPFGGSWPWLGPTTVLRHPAPLRGAVSRTAAGWVVSPNV